MPRPSENTKQGQEAATKRARAALASQDDRRARRPLENKPSRSSTRTDHRSANQPKLDLQKHLEPNTASPDIAALLKHYGITTVPRPVYEWGGYRYTNPTDAIAAAKRGVSA